MGAVGGMFGLAGGDSGTGFQTGSGVNPGQINQSYTGVQNSLDAQKALLAAIQAQNGLGNQSQVYNQLQGVVNGTGPNPAQAQLAQATGANVANQAALMAGQRGAGANVGLMARQAAQAGAGAQQQAVGQAATLQAQQSLGALGQAGNMANVQAGNQIGQTNANTQGQLELQRNLLTNQAQNNSVQGELAKQGMSNQQQAIGGLMNGAAMAMAGGGTVPGPSSSAGKFLSGMGQTMAPSSGLQSGVSSLVGKVASMIEGSGPTPQTDLGFKAPTMGSEFSQTSPSLGVNTNLMPSSQQPNAFGVKTQFSKGGDVAGKLKSGGKVPGKAKEAGNSYSNDNVKALLSPGEGVIDRETMNEPGQVGDAARFVMAYVNQKKMKNG